MIIYLTFIPNTVDMETATTTVATELLPSTLVTEKQLETGTSRITSTTRLLIEYTTETALSTTAFGPVFESVLAN